MSTYDESAHPRAKDGKYTAKPAIEQDCGMDSLPAPAADKPTAWEEKAAAATEAVGAILGLRTRDDGGGPYLALVDRSAQDEPRNDLLAFPLSPDEVPEGDPSAGHWRTNDGEDGAVVVADHLTVDSDPAEVAAWLTEQQAQHRQRAVEELAAEMNCWYSCASQATVFYAEETLNHPDDPDAALAATRARYDAHEARRSEVWFDELPPDEAMECAQAAIATLTDGQNDRGVFADGWDESPHLRDQLPTGDRLASARLFVDASKPEARTW